MTATIWAAVGLRGGRFTVQLLLMWSTSMSRTVPSASPLVDLLLAAFSLIVFCRL
jgi:hypothetical protein